MSIKDLTLGTLAASLGALLAFNAWAQPVLITLPQTLNPGATTITPTAGGAPVPLATADITVSGTTLTVNGRHTVRNLVLENNAVVNHSTMFSYDYSGGAGTDVVNGMWLNVQANPTGGDVNIQAGSRIDVRGRGNSTGPGAGTSATTAWGSGGGHGGRGGSSQTNVGGSTYGSSFLPSAFGSGGGISLNYSGGQGGGVIRLSVGGVLTVSGTITANAFNGAVGGAGGSGGSVHLEAAQIAGAGSITANGGNSSDGNGGGGGGGRIAVYFGSSSFTGATTAIGGTGWQRGGAGTVVTKATSASAPSMRISNGSTTVGATTPWPTEFTVVDSLTVVQGASVTGCGLSAINSLTLTDAAVLSMVTPITLPSLEILRGAVLTHDQLAASGVNLTTMGDVLIDTTSRIDVSGRGHPGGTGPGVGQDNNTGNCCGRGGGSHAGRGGASHTGSASGPTYGSVTQPTLFGSGGTNRSIAAGGGAGGGVVRLTVGGVLTVNGVVASNGQDRAGDSAPAAGGSVWINTTTLTGSGTVSANGGIATPVSVCGGGGGGRVAIYSCNITLPISNIRVLGGISPIQFGQPGSLYFGSSSIEITRQPIGGDYRGGDFFQLGVQATSPNGELTYQWRKKNESGEFIPMTEGQGGGVFTDVTGPTLIVSGVSCDGGGEYDCLICDSCGCYPSNVANLNVQSLADFNNDGGIDGLDIEDFFAAWESGSSESDVNLDGGIDGTDVELFFVRWESGC